jgi:transposase
MPKALKSGRRLDRQACEIILNIYLYFLTENERFKHSNNADYFSKVQQRVSEASGISRRTVSKILQKEYQNKSITTSPKMVKLGRPNKLFCLDLDDFDYSVIRRLVYNFHLIYKQVPTIKALKSKLSDAINFTGCDFTLRKILRKMGFRYKKVQNNRKLLIEKDDVRLKRVKFLAAIKKYRSQERDIVYMDETYIHTSHLTAKSWVDSSEIGVKQLISKGQRLIIVHAGSRKGFIPGALLMYQSTDKTGDYHNAMNSENYEKWVRNQLIPNLAPHSVLVVDNAAYHNKYVERPPNSNATKQKMIDWLTKHNIPIDPTLKKIEMYEIVCKHKQDLVEYSLDKIMKEYGHSVLRLPPYHPDFNPIENIWSQIKGYVSKRNINMNMTTVKLLVQEKINMIGPDIWAKVCDHAIKCENEYRTHEDQLENHMDSFVITVRENSDDDTPENSSDSDCDMDVGSTILHHTVNPCPPPLIQFS